MKIDFPIGILGYGTVGKEVVRRLSAGYTENSGYRFPIKKILVQNPDKDRGSTISKEKFTTNPDDILCDNEVKAVVSLLGGYEFEKTCIVRALGNGKHVITGNKSVVSKDLPTILEIARENNVYFKFSATVGGSVALIPTIQHYANYGRIREVRGILNGTSNFMITKMGGDEDIASGQQFPKVLSFKEALMAAQDEGLAEQNPEADVEGYDQAQKTAIIGACISGKLVNYEQIPREGITKVDTCDIDLARRLEIPRKSREERETHFAIRLISVIKLLENGKLEMSVGPTLVPETDELAKVYGAENAVSIFFENEKRPYTIKGPGAGKETARNPISDLISVATSVQNKIQPELDLPKISYADAQDVLVNPDELESPYYIRSFATHNPGSFNVITNATTKFNMNIEDIDQLWLDPATGLKPIGVLVQKTTRKNVNNLVREVSSSPVLKKVHAFPVYGI